MKLLYCPHCEHVFSLHLHLRSCECGKVKGRYDPNGATAVVNGKGYSIAIGNGSFNVALAMSHEMTADFRQDDPWKRHSTSIICWARPHTGPANPHTRVDPEVA